MTEEDVTVPRYARLMWGEDDDTRPGPKRSIDVHDIAAAGVRLADRGGIAALSMRAVATEVGLSSMALYRYVESKRELELMILDAAYGPPPQIRSGRRGWRSQLHEWGVALRDGLLAHPWVVAVPVGEPPLLPNSVRWMERALQAMRGTTLTEQQKLSALLLIDVYVRGQIALAAGLDPQDASAGGDTRYARRLLSLADEDEFPRLHEALHAGALNDDDDAVDEFEFGLGAVLDGIGALMGRR